MRVALNLFIHFMTFTVLLAQDVEVVFPFDYTTDYEDVYVAEGGRGFAVGSCGILATTENGSDWTITDAPATSVGNPFTMVACTPGTNCQEVWLGTDQELVYSDDGGQSWASISVESLGDPREMHFLGNNTMVLSHSSGSVIRSTDGGESWTEVLLPGSYRGTAHFVRDDLAFLLDQNNYNLLRSTDMGASWDSIAHFEDRPLYMDMVDANVGYMIIGLRTLLKTTDGGQNWTVANESVNASPRVIVAFDENNLMVSSFPSSLVLSTDGGVTWDNIPQPLEDGAYGIRLNGLHRQGDQVWIASDAASILYSSDRLQTRSNQLPADRQSIESIQFANANVGYALCERRGMFKTTDGGDNWTRIETDFFTVSRDFLVRSADEVIIPYNSSGPQRTLDGGQTWSPLFPEAIQDSTYIFQIEELPGGRLYLMGSVHAAWSDDNGASWSVIYHGLGGFSDMLYFYDDNLGFAGGQGGRLSRTTDGGETWTSILQGDLTNQPIRNIYMRDDLHGFINISSSTYCTDDGGLTWDAQACNGYNPPGMVTIAPNGDLFSTARSGAEQRIAYSTDQGLTWTDIAYLCTSSHRLLGVSNDSRYLYGGWTGSLITRIDLSNISDVDDPLARPLNLEAFPNPTTGMVHVPLPEEFQTGPLDVFLYNLQGQLIRQESHQVANRLQLDIQNLARGMYLLKVNGTNGSGQVRLIRQ